MPPVAPDRSVSKPLVSILTPSSNQANWLADARGSVENRSYPNIEHIVMDGGSTDGSVELLRKEGGSHVRWWSEADRGQSHALNKALAISHGGIIGWLNPDDAYFARDAVAMADLGAAFPPDPAQHLQPHHPADRVHPSVSAVGLHGRRTVRQRDGS